jgi:TRAP-type C4-dicarboxylate transport system permease small subunit
MEIYQKFETAIRRISFALSAIGGAIILFSVVPITLDVTTRKLFNAAWFESYEVSSYGFAVAVALGYAHAFLTGSHIRIDILTRTMPLPAKALMGILAVVSLVFVSALLSIQAWETVAQSIKLDAHSNSTLRLPLAIPQALWAFGLSWFAAMCFIIASRQIFLLLQMRFTEIDILTKGVPDDDPDDPDRFERTADELGKQ